MTTSDEKLVHLALQALTSGELTEKDRIAFSRDHIRYKNGELTLRELLEAIREPKGDLKDAMVSYYDGSVYNRSFKSK